jgi:DNA-binding FrmR family transcriptional regulator
MLSHTHSSYSVNATQSKRAKGRLRYVFSMIVACVPCPYIGKHLFAVERTICAAIRTMIYDHIALRRPRRDRGAVRSWSLQAREQR